jgi:hypothetical protein
MHDRRAPVPELPVEGFPVGATPVRAWFLRRYGREPGMAELVRLLNAMAAREATPPVEETAADQAGWALGADDHPRSRLR